MAMNSAESNGQISWAWLYVLKCEFLNKNVDIPESKSKLKNIGHTIMLRLKDKSNNTLEYNLYALSSIIICTM